MTTALELQPAPLVVFVHSQPRTVQESVFKVMRVLARALRILIQGRNIHRFPDSYVSVRAPEAAMGSKLRAYQWRKSLQQRRLKPA
jgi:hypothetical protein